LGGNAHNPEASNVAVQQHVSSASVAEAKVANLHNSGTSRCMVSTIKHHCVDTLEGWMLKEPMQLLEAVVCCGMLLSQARCQIDESATLTSLSTPAPYLQQNSNSRANHRWCLFVKRCLC
jgi:hypothetical protein